MRQALQLLCSLRPLNPWKHSFSFKVPSNGDDTEEEGIDSFSASGEGGRDGDGDGDEREG